MKSLKVVSPSLMPRRMSMGMRMMKVCTAIDPLTVGLLLTIKSKTNKV